MAEELWKVLGFYSGKGGMKYSIMKAGVAAIMVEAFDISDKANDVYAHNFSHCRYQELQQQWLKFDINDKANDIYEHNSSYRSYQGNIQSLTAVDLDKYKAILGFFLLSTNHTHNDNL